MYQANAGENIPWHSKPSIFCKHYVIIQIWVTELGFRPTAAQDGKSGPVLGVVSPARKEFTLHLQISVQVAEAKVIRTDSPFPLDHCVLDLQKMKKKKILIGQLTQQLNMMTCESSKVCNPLKLEQHKKQQIIMDIEGERARVLQPAVTLVHVHVIRSVLWPALNFSLGSLICINILGCFFICSRWSVIVSYHHSFTLFIFYFNPNNFCITCQARYCMTFFLSSDTISSLTHIGVLPPALL